MKTILMYCALCLFCTLPVAAADQKEASQKDSLQKELMWHRVDFKEGSSHAEVNFRVWFKHSPQKVFEVLTDTKSFSTKLSNYSDARTLTKNLYKSILDVKPRNAAGVVGLIGGNVIDSYHNRQKEQNWTDYLFLEFNFPWPFKDRWAVQKVRIDETNANQGEYSFSYEMQLGNFEKLKGTWKLKPVKERPGWTEFTGHYQTDPGIPAPKFLVRRAARNGLQKDIESYREILKRDL